MLQNNSLFCESFDRMGTPAGIVDKAVVKESYARMTTPANIFLKYQALTLLFDKTDRMTTPGTIA